MSGRNPNVTVWAKLANGPWHALRPDRGTAACGLYLPEPAEILESRGMPGAMCADCVSVMRSSIGDVA